MCTVQLKLKSLPTCIYSVKVYKFKKKMDVVELANFRRATAGDVSLQQSQGGYRDWAMRYEEIFNTLGRTAHVKLSEYVAACFAEDERKTVKILDVGAGTGLVGLELKRQGFLHVDALEPNEAMINEAKRRCLYENYIVDFLTEKPTCIQKGSYDVLTGSGIFLDEVHVPFEALKEMIRIVKPGGFIFLSARIQNLEVIQNNQKLEDVMDRLVREGQWERLGRYLIPDYTKNIDESGVIWKYRVKRAV